MTFDLTQKANIVGRGGRDVPDQQDVAYARSCFRSSV